MKKGSTELVFVLDKSGSMAGLESDTIGGFNAMLNKQKVVAGECRITTVLFDHRCLLLHDRIDIRAVSPMTEREYFVGGSTALLDAVGMAVHKLEAVRESTAEAYRAEKVVFVIITDGAENASREYSAPQVRAMIQRERAEHGWEFIFLGANIDAVETAERFGIARSRAADYVPDEAGTALNFQAMSKAVATFRETSVVPDEALEAIRKDARRRGGRK